MPTLTEAIPAAQLAFHAVAEDRTTFLNHIALAKTSPVAAVVSAPRPAVMPALHSLAQYQTPIKNQGSRGTCWAFAGAAAVEAFYKRKYNVTLDLSEQYIFHLGKVQEIAYSPMDPNRSHENNCTVWDGQGASDVLLKLQRSAMCTENFAPYLQSEASVQGQVGNGASLASPSTNPPQAVMDDFEFREALIPAAARANCKYLVTGVATPGKFDSATLAGVIASGTEVVVDLMLDYTVDVNGVWQDNGKTGGPGHTLLLIGFDDGGKYFLAKNSWGGTDWYKLGYSFIDKSCGWAHYITGVRDPNAGNDLRAHWMGTWNMDHDGWRGTLNFRRHTNYRNDNDGAPIRLGSYVRDGVTYDVNGHFENNFSHCVFYIAPDGKRVQPGTEVGQRFDMYCFSWDIQHCAGRTTSGGQPFGALLSRPALPAFVKKAFAVGDWVGRYTVNHDGWPGVLTISSVAPFHAAYVDNTGKAQAVTGSINGHECKCTIAGQAYDLLYHTWEHSTLR